jgi:DNA-binding NtrC family response regulator
LQKALLEHDWPGNVRELEVVRKFAILRNADAIAPDLTTCATRTTFMGAAAMGAAAGVSEAIAKAQLPSDPFLFWRRLRAPSTRPKRRLLLQR